MGRGQENVKLEVNIAVEDWRGGLKTVEDLEKVIELKATKRVVVHGSSKEAQTGRGQESTGDRQERSLFSRPALRPTSRKTPPIMKKRLVRQFQSASWRRFPRRGILTG
jgi:hypothetical protein